MKARSVRNLQAALALITGISTSAIAVGQTAPTAPGQEPAKKDLVKMEAFSVVGSRIKRMDVETPSPAVRITAAELQATGFTTVDDALRAMPFNNGSAITGDGSGTGFASGTSTINLRGLGTNNTLVLLNGRRIVPSGAGAFNGFQSVIDLRQIPTAAIESLEVLKDGASAIYGSDAVAGVVNIQLKREYSGLGVDVSYGNTFETDSNEITAFVIAGASNDKTNIVVMADFYRRAALMNRDFSWSNNADMRANKTGAGQLEFDPTSGLLSGVDLRSSFGFPSRFFIPGTATQMSYLNPTTDPTPGSAAAISRVTGVGFYNFQQVSSLTPEIEARGIIVSFKHQFTDSIYAFADLMYKRIETINLSAAAPFTTTDRGGGPTGRLVVPAASPYNPYGTRYFGTAGQSIELNSFRVVNAGARVVDANSDYPRYLWGLGGKLPNEWDWEAAYMYAQGTFDNSSPGTAFDDRVQQALNGLNIDGQLLYANPFGPEDPRVTDYYSGTNPTKTKFTSNLYDASVNGTIFQLPAGDVGAAVGTEFRTESISDVRTLENENGNVVGGSEGFGYEGKRNVTSLYAELQIPIFKSATAGRMEAQIAGRFEDYSDFGTTTKPKYAVAYRPFKWLMIRGSYSESFKAPDLAYLYTKGSVSFTSGQLFDPRRPDVPSAQIKTLGRGNANLQPEETSTTFYGIVLEAPSDSILKGFSAEISHFKFDQKNLITRDSANFTLANELILPAGRVVRRALTPAEVAAGISVGTIDFIATDWINANKFVNEGWDFAVAYTLETSRFGKFGARAEATYYEDAYRVSINSLGATTVIDQDGRENFPLWRGSGSLTWTKGDWTANVQAVYIGKYPSESLLGLGAERDVDAQWIINPQVSWRAPWQTTLTVGIRNVFNTEPPLYMPSQFGYNPGVNPVVPAFWYVRASRQF